MGWIHADDEDFDSRRVSVGAPPTCKNCGRVLFASSTVWGICRECDPHFEESRVAGFIAIKPRLQGQTWFREGANTPLTLKEIEVESGGLHLKEVGSACNGTNRIWLGGANQVNYWSDVPVEEL